MKSLLLIGAGGHCHSCIDVIESTNKFRIVGLVQPESFAQLITLGYPVIGSDEDLPELLKDVNMALIAVGHIKTSETRIRLFELLKKLKAELPIIISPNAYLSKHSIIGEGSIIMHGGIVNAGAQIGNNCIVNSKALIEHDVKIHDHCHISTGALINGNVSIGRGTFIGSGAIIKEGISLGDNVIVGAGQVVLQDVATGLVVKNER